MAGAPGSAMRQHDAAFPLEVDSSAAGLIDELALARQRTDRMFALVADSLLFERPVAERHRIAFYLGHLEAFDTNLLLLQRNNSANAARQLDRLFAFGIDPVGIGLPTDTPQDWPSIAEIRHYVAHSRSQLDRWLMQRPDRSPDGVSFATLLNAAIEHRLMHAETLAYILNRLPVAKPLRPVAAGTRQFRDDDMVAVPSGAATLGIWANHAVFGWDNEYAQHQTDVAEFAIDRYMVTNAQFLRFIDSGGYDDRRWWTSADWQWRQSSGVTHPASWQSVDGEWRLQSVADVIPFQGDWPVHLSHAEASAYANWIGKRLPSEAQWHRAAYSGSPGEERNYPWGDAAPADHLGNFDFQRWDPLPVDAHPAGNSALGVAGLVGNGWEWTATPFAPFRGFRPFSFYPGYSADFFDGRHFVLKGGSQHSAARLLRRSFRNWFQPHYPYPCAGFRCVRVP
jgi:iron(II)-dependent oxidoreductase